MGPTGAHQLYNHTQQPCKYHIENASLNSSQATLLNSRSPIESNDDATRFGNLDTIGEIGITEEFINEIDSRIKGLSVVMVGGTTSIYADIGIERKIPIRYLGDGITRLLSIILAIANSKNGCLLIDEIENGIHYSIMPKIWMGIAKAAKEFDCQIIATTHSYECLASAYSGLNSSNFNEDFTYIHLEEDDDKIVPKAFTGELLATALNANMEVR